MLERIKLWLVLQRVFLVMKVSTRFPLILTLGLPDGVSLWCVFGFRVSVDLVLTHFGYFILLILSCCSLEIGLVFSHRQVRHSRGFA